MASIRGPRELVDLVAARRSGVLTTLKSDGRPQLSNVTYAFYPGGDDAGGGNSSGTVRVSITADRAKYKNLLRDPRASLHVTTEDFWAYAVAEATADLSPVAADPADATVDELVQLYRDVQGEHPDWQEYRQVMVRDRRVVLRLPIERVYGMPPRA